MEKTQGGTFECSECYLNENINLLINKFSIHKKLNSFHSTIYTLGRMHYSENQTAYPELCTSSYKGTSGLSSKKRNAKLTNSHNNKYVILYLH